VASYLLKNAKFVTVTSHTVFYYYNVGPHITVTSHTVFYYYNVGPQ